MKWLEPTQWWTFENPDHTKQFLCKCSLPNVDIEAVEVYSIDFQYAYI